LPKTNLLKASPQEGNPERIILNLTSTPAVSQAVTWRTREPLARPRGQITLAVAKPDLHKDSRTVKAVTESVHVSREETVYHHSVVFQDLKPNTLYAYRVGDTKNWSEWFHFRTADEGAGSFQFVYFGDPQNGIKSLCSRTFRTAFQKAPDARFWLITGDIVSHGSNDEEWSEFFYALGWISGMTPIVPLPGNHGYRRVEVNGEKEYRITHLWRPQFTLPENGPDGLEETAYFIDYQDARFVMLNGNEKRAEQAEWLDNVLAENSRSWIIVSIHQPFYSTGEDRDNPHLRKLFVPVFDKYSVDLVLQGHDHNYGRTGKLRDSQLVGDDEKGTVYVVSVSGPKVYTMNPRYEEMMVKMGTGRQLFQIITIEGNRLTYESVTATGERYDYFELEK
jgi:3',5'-cyclic AMP phosphodiesterase CpdA